MLMRFLSSSLPAVFLHVLVLMPFSRYVIANDLSHSATTAMMRNVELNGLSGTTVPEGSGHGAERNQGKVRINEGDAR